MCVHSGDFYKNEVQMKFFGSRLSLRLTQLINESNHHKVVNDKNQVNGGFHNRFNNYSVPIKFSKRSRWSRVHPKGKKSETEWFWHASKL